MHEDIEIPDENIFGWIGMKDNGDHYAAVSGIYDYFWSLKPETREKMIYGWIEALEAFLDPDFEENLDEFATGLTYVNISSPVEEKIEEVKIEGNVIPFRRK